MEAIDVLLIEDNPSDAELTLHVFKKYNFASRIKVLHDGAEGLKFLFDIDAGVSQHSERAIKVIVLDLKLPKVSGLEVLAQIRADPRTKTIPVVVLTSSREDRDLLACYALGVNSYIVKPVDFTRFSEAVRQLGMYWLLVNESPIPVITPPGGLKTFSGRADDGTSL